ncbi:MAG: MGMT family protein [Candidatus Nitrosocaldus sp.]|nr:MGMT family protein [Candidatus Nitrosocaldus sp.]
MDHDHDANDNDMGVDMLSSRVYMLVSMIPKGRICTYADIARAIGRPRAYRLVGRILNRNPNPVIVPCHRVVKSNGSVGGYMHGHDVKRALLESEGVHVDCKGRIIGFDSVRFKFDLGSEADK